MDSKLLLKIIFALVFLSLLWQTIEASLVENVFVGGARIWEDAWGRATLMDAYFGFVAFFVFVVYKESGWLKRLGWFLFIFTMGNFAISGYMFWQLQKLKKDQPWTDIFRR